MKPAALFPLPVPECSNDKSYQYSGEHRFSPGVTVSRLLGALIPCLTGIGSLYQAVAAARDRRNHPPPGMLLEVDGCRLHLQTSGQGGPSVVLESGLGGMSCAWGWIQPETAKFSRVVSYDRAGLGWSGPDTAPKTAALAASRLHSALEQARVPPPYVLVGHSMGGLFIRVFADLYPDEVAGLVLLDAVHPDQHLRSAAIRTHMRTGFTFLSTIPLLSRLGYVRLAGLFDAWFKGLPAQQAAESEVFLSTYHHLKTTRDESLAWETICTEVRSTRGLGNTPLTVITAGRDILPGQPELQRELAALSFDSVHLVVKGADHLSLITRRKHALIVVETIRQAVARASGNR